MEQDKKTRKNQRTETKMVRQEKKPTKHRNPDTNTNIRNNNKYLGCMET